MANYNTIRGLRVKYLSADPAGAEDGQVWYNSTTGNLRVEGILGTAAWSSGGEWETARRLIGGFRTLKLQELALWIKPSWIIH